MKWKKCGQELEIGVKFCPNCGEDCVSQDTGIPVKESVDKTKSAINDFGENMQKKEVEISGKKFNMLEVLTFGSGILAIISCFLPFASVSIFGYSQSVSLMDGGDGIICIALVVVALILSYLHKDIVALGLAGATAVLAVYEIFNAKSVLGGYGNISIGAYLLLLAAIGLVAGIFLVYNNTKKQQN